MDLNKAKKILEENKNVFNEISEEFYQTRKKFRTDLEYLKNYVIKQERVLDLGCGSGRLFELFIDKGVDYVGVDFSNKLVEKARETYGDYFRVADILSLPFPDHYFDSVWSIAVLHHIPSMELRKCVLGEVRRVLKPNGRVIATCWNLYQGRYLRLLLKSFFRKDVFVPFQGKKRYYHIFTKRELGKLFKEAGFKIEELKHLKQNNKKTNILIIATPHTG